MAGTNSNRHAAASTCELRLGYAATATQFAALVVLAARGGPWPPGAAIRGWLIAGAGLGAWAIASMGRRTVRVTPDPKPGGTLAVRGPYRWIRHPMYSAVLTIGGAWSVAAPDAATLGAASALVLAVATKIVLEERFLSRTYPGWEAMRRRTRRLIPFVF